MGFGYRRDTFNKLFGNVSPKSCAGYGLEPSGVQFFAPRSLHPRFEDAIRSPEAFELRDPFPKTCGKPGEVGGSKRGRLRVGGLHDAPAEDVGLKLHQKVVARGAAVHAKLFERLTAI